MIKESRQYITSKELKSWMDSDKEFLLIDVLPENYYQQKHIPGAENACVYEVAFLDKIKKMNPDELKTVVVYGERNGFFAAASAFTKLSDSGYKEVFELEGGIEAWEKSGFEVVRTNEREITNYVDASLHQNKRKLKVSTEKSKIRWTGRNLANLHFGYLTLKNGILEVSNGELTGGDFTINMQSIVCEDLKDASMNKGLINHLLSADFFESSRFPEAYFKITRAELLKNVSPGAPNYKIAGEFTLKGISHEIVFDAVIGWNMEAALFAQATLEIDRTKWNVMYGSGRFFERLGMHLVNDLISLQLFISAE